MRPKDNVNYCMYNKKTVKHLNKISAMIAFAIDNKNKKKRQYCRDCGLCWSNLQPSSIRGSRGAEGASRGPEHTNSLPVSVALCDDNKNNFLQDNGAEAYSGLRVHCP